MVAQTFNPRAWEAEGSRLVQGQPGLYIELQARQSYKMRPRLKREKENKLVSNLLKYSYVHFTQLLSIIVRLGIICSRGGNLVEHFKSGYVIPDGHR